MRDLKRDFSYNVRRMYHVLQAGSRRIDLGQPVTGSEAMSGWYWRELSSSDVGVILAQLHYRTLVNKFLASKQELGTGVLLEQFYKDPDLPAPAEPGVVARAIQLGVQDGAFGLAELQGDQVVVDSLKYKSDIAFDAVSFEPGLCLVSREKCEALLAQVAAKAEPVSPQAGEAAAVIGTGGAPTPVPGVGPASGVAPKPSAEMRYRRLRLVVADVPAGKIADVNRGILMPISAAVGDFKFTLEIDVSSDEGISQATMENKIKETIRQIGARVTKEETE